MTTQRACLLLVGLLAGALALPGCGPQAPPLDVMEADPARAYADARTAVYRAAEDRDPLLRVWALESLALTEGPAAGPLYMQALGDPVVAVQFAAALAIGDSRYAPARPRLAAMAGHPQVDPNVQTALIYALHRLGDNTHTARLGTLLFADSPEVRANAALAMAKIGNPSAIKPLESLLADEANPGVKLQLTESLTMLGETRSKRLLQAYTRAGAPHERVQATQALGRTGQREYVNLLAWLTGPDQPAPVRLAAVESLGRLGDVRGFPLAVAGVADPLLLVQQGSKDVKALTDPQRMQLQVLGALALGAIDRPGGVDPLLPLLQSPDGPVRVAAGRSILLLLRDQAPPAPAPDAPIRQVPPSRGLRTAPPKE